jgi:CDP-glycerol glycerophosphotransferase
MPNFVSVVVPVWNVQGYLNECLDSLLLHQTVVDVEVIGVDDASTDYGGEVLDERAATDPRLSVTHRSVKGGPGPARNSGLEHATGEYLWFVDGDDRIVPGALSVIEAKLREEKPDVLVVGMARERWNRSVSRWKTPGEVVLGAPALTRAAPPLGSLVVRRQFLLDAGIRFREGSYEDVAFGYAVLAQAETVSTVEPACYIHRLDRAGSIRAGSIRAGRSARDADLVTQLDAALSVPALASAEPKVRRRALERAVTAVRDLMDQENAGVRRKVFDRLAELVRKHSKDATGRRMKLIAQGSYGSYQLLFGSRDRVRAATGKARKAVGTRRARLRKRALSRYYKRELGRPIDENLAVYAAYWYRGYACNPAAIYEKAQELAPTVKGVWVVKPGAPVPPGVTTVNPGTRDYYRVLARAKYLINNATFPPEVVKRPGAVHVQTHHGTPLKTMGLDQPKFPASTVGFDAERMRRNIAKWDFSVTANRHTTLLWDRQFPIKGETLETGYPRNDRLALATAEDTAAARAELGLADGERVVLYAPTHREWHATFTPVLDVEKLADALGPGTRVLLRGHYFYDSIGFPPQHPRVIDVSRHESVEQLMLAADVMITDFSSVMFDYAVLDKPLVIFAPDWEVYRTVRGVTFDLAAEHPGTFARTFDELVDAFESGQVVGDEAAAYRARFRERFCSLEDGHAAERVVRRVFLGEKR